MTSDQIITLLAPVLGLEADDYCEGMADGADMARAVLACLDAAGLEVVPKSP